MYHWDYSLRNTKMCYKPTNNNVNLPIFLPTLFYYLYILTWNRYGSLEFSYRSERDSGGASLRSFAHVNSLKRGVRMTKSRSIANLSGM